MSIHLINKKQITNILLSLFVMLVLPVGNCNAQWSFTATLAYTENCPIQPIQISIPIPGLPDKNMCESLRQTLSSFKTSTPTLNNKGQVIGYCTLQYNCTACSGFDMGAQAGAISVNGLASGNPIFTPHPSASLTDWVQNYRQQLQSLGMTDRDIDAIANQQFPSTDDRAFNESYAAQAAAFTPKKQAEINDPNVVDLTGKAGIIDPNDLAMPTKSLAEETKTITQEKVDKPSPLASTVPPLEPIVNNKIDASLHPNIELGLDIINAATDIVAPGWVGEGLKTGFTLVAFDMQAIVDINNNKPCPSTEQILVNTLERRKEAIVGKAVSDINEAAESATERGALLLANALGKKMGISNLDRYRALKTFKKAEKLYDDVTGAKEEVEGQIATTQQWSGLTVRVGEQIVK